MGPQFLEPSGSEVRAEVTGHAHTLHTFLGLCATQRVGVMAMYCFHKTPFVILHVEQKLSSRPQMPCPEGFGAAWALDLLAVMGCRCRLKGH